MGRATFTFNRNVNTDARWQDYITKLHNGLVAAGLTHVPFTGELSLTSTRPANNSAANGGRLYQFDDADKATYPVFVKVTPILSRSADVPIFYIEPGFAHNGSGGFTGNAGVGLWTAPSTAPTDGDAETYIGHGEGYLHIHNNISTQTRDNANVYFVERPVTGDVAAGSVRGIANGLQGYFGGRCQVVPRTGAVPSYFSVNNGFWGHGTWTGDYTGAYVPWQWTYGGDNDSVLLPGATFPFFGQAATLRVCYAPHATIPSPGVIAVGPTGQKIDHYWGANVGAMPDMSYGTNYGIGTRYEA